MTHNHHAEFDAHMMDVALAMARRGQGTTWPNPSVGAVVADEHSGEIIARGWTQPGGRPHAEPVALSTAGARAGGKTLYVTLEPCSHFGQTPPCVASIIGSGIGRVVVAQTDPDPRVAGRGLARLKEAGIDVTLGTRREEARRIVLGHILRVTERRPFVQIKMALSRDGDIAQGDGSHPVWVTGEKARAHGHMLRATADAILIGRGTLEDDNPQLTCRLPGLAHRSPVRVVVSNNALGDHATKQLFASNESPVWWVQGLASKAAANSPPDGVTVIQVTTVEGQIWLPALAEELVANGVTRLLVEGGPTMWRAFAQAGLVDEVVAFIANGNDRDSTAGGAAKTGVTATEAEALIAHKLPKLRLSLSNERPMGSDRMFTFEAKGK